MGCGIKLVGCGTSLAIQWLSLHTSPAGSMGSLPGQGTKILPAMQHEKKKSELYQYLKKIKQSKRIQTDSGVGERVMLFEQRSQ